MVVKAAKRFIPSTLRSDLWRLMVLSAIVGAVAGLGSVMFYTLLDLSKWFFTEYAIGLHPLPPGGEAPLLAAPAVELRKWMLFIVPTLGGLASGILVYSLAPEAEGHGTDAAIDAYHKHGGRVRARVPFVKTISSAITIGTGGSGGREGPIAQIGSGFGSMLAGWLKLRPHDRRVLMAAGMGAGIGSIFHAPLAGALFAAEVLYKELDLEYEVLIPAVIASIVAYAVFALNFGWDPLFVTPNFTFHNPAQLLPYFILALVVSGGAVTYIKVFYGIRDLFAKLLKVPNHVKPAIGGLLLGCIAFFVPGALGTGYGVVQGALLGKVGAWTLLLIGGAKILTTSFTIASGGSGGVFGPAIVIGGALGGGVGILMQQLFPGMGIQPGAFTLVGMAGFFAAAANTPLSTIIMVSEMTGNYHLLVPSMWVCVIGFMICKRWTIYEKQIGSRFDAPIHTGNMLKAVLKGISVQQVLDYKNQNHEKLLPVPEHITLDELLDRFSNSGTNGFPVVDESGKLTGMIGVCDLRYSLGKPELNSLIVASDLAHNPIVVYPEDSLFRVIQLMATHKVEELIVVREKDPTKPLAVINRQDVVVVYQQELFSSAQNEVKA